VDHRVVALILIFFSYLAGAQEVVWEPVEEVVAVVDRTPLLRTDVDLAEILGLVERAPELSDREYRSALLDARIRLEVQFRDLEASGVLYRLEIDVEAVRRALLDAAGGLEALRPALEASGISDADIDELALRVSAVNAYAEQRLRPRISVSMQEIEAAHGELVLELQSRGEPAPTLSTVQEQLHRLIAERKLNDEIERWLDRALVEREVTRFVP
jgi:hypothetical protein